MIDAIKEIPVYIMMGALTLGFIMFVYFIVREIYFEIKYWIAKIIVKERINERDHSKNTADIKKSTK